MYDFQIVMKRKRMFISKGQEDEEIFKSIKENSLKIMISFSVQTNKDRLHGQRKTALFCTFFVICLPKSIRNGFAGQKKMIDF